MAFVVEAALPQFAVRAVIVAKKTGVRTRREREMRNCSDRFVEQPDN
jgi:hypothetical protein